MNLRTKKENINPNKVLGDKTNVANTKLPAGKKEKKVEIVKTTKTKPAKTKKARKTLNLASPVKQAAISHQDKENAKPRSPYCFGFSDSDLETDPVPCDVELTEFDNSKPYRLALYVKPSKRIRLDQSLIQQVAAFNPSLNLNRPSPNNTINNSTFNVTKQQRAKQTKENTTVNVSKQQRVKNSKENSTLNVTKQKQAKQSVNDTTLLSPDRTAWKVPFSSTPIVPAKKRGRLVQQKITDVFVSPKRTRAGNSEQTFASYFETSQNTDEENTPPPKMAKKSKDETTGAKSGKDYKTLQLPSSEESSSEDQGSETITRFPKPTRRSYIKRPRPAPDPEDDTPTEEILKSIEKNKKKAKTKKPSKEEEEFEKWSQSMNSVFTEVDKFEISFD